MNKPNDEDIRKAADVVMREWNGTIDTAGTRQLEVKIAQALADTRTAAYAPKEGLMRWWG